MLIIAYFILFFNEASFIRRICFLSSELMVLLGGAEDGGSGVYSDC